MNIDPIKGRLWLCIPIMVTDLLDATVTMLGQPAGYWQGSYELVNEFNPFARWLLTIHPIGIVVYTVLDVAVISMLIIVLPLMLSKTLSAFWAIGSAKAIYNWLVGPLHMGWWFSNIALLIPTMILVYAFEKASAHQVRADRDDRSQYKRLIMNVSDVIRKKRAIRKFQDKPLPEDVVLAILNAGRRSQSSKNEQTWQFIAIRDRAILEALSQFGTWAGHLAGAALGVAILTPDPTKKFQTMFDAGQAAAYMQLLAWELGVGSCLASIYEHEKAREILGFPAEWHLRIALSFGYPADEEKLSAAPKKGGRRQLEAIVHWDRW